LNLLQGRAVRQNLAVNAGLSHTTSYQLGVLRSEDKYDDSFVADIVSQKVNLVATFVRLKPQQRLEGTELYFCDSVSQNRHSDFHILK